MKKRLLPSSFLLSLIAAGGSLAALPAAAGTPQGFTNADMRQVSTGWNKPVTAYRIRAGAAHQLTDWAPQPAEEPTAQNGAPVPQREPVAAAPEAIPPDLSDKPVRVLHSVFPKYPEPAKVFGIEGLVEVGMVVGTNGLIEDAYVVRSPHNWLSTAAIDAVKQWRFEPVKRNGQPVKVRVVQRFPFRILD